MELVLAKEHGEPNDGSAWPHNVDIRDETFQHQSVATLAALRGVAAAGALGGGHSMSGLGTRCITCP